jgi:cysteine-rich repeat protein
LPSTHGGVSASGETNCTLCDVSYFCPGDGLDYACPSQKLTVPRFGAISQADCKNPTCGNGILELGEECDDGPFSGRGCSTACQFEDACDCAAGPQFVCNMTLFGVAGCCSSLRNPVTLENVCTCKNQVSDYAGYKVRSDCSLQEIDECNIDNGGCNLNAICMNLDGLLKNGTHECRCPPGLIGDGVVRCDIFLFETQVGFNLLGISLSDVNTTELIDAFLAENAALMAGKNANDVRVELQEYIDSLALRHRNVLQDSSSGVTIKIIISSNDALQMENFTSATDALGIAVFLQDFYQAPVEIESEPTSAIQTMDAVYGTVNTIVTGFNVLDISYNKTSLEWLVRVQYVPNSPNTIASMYVTKANSPPYTQTVKDSFMISKHPCMQSSSACCLTSYAANYHIGSFAQNISRVIGPCSLATQMADTYGMFDPSANAEMLLTTLEGLPYSYVTRLTPTTLLLHINRMALQDKVATRTPFAGGFVMDFFVGMSYYTLLPTNAIATVASQAKIQARFTDALVFATSTEQDYSLAEYITLALFQTKYAPDLLYEHKMQYVRVSFVLPESVRQNMDTGLIPLSSIRFAIAKALPASEDTQQWQNPCYSSDNTALFDNSTSSMRYLYTVAAHQTCALQPRLCQNPPTETLTESGLIEFWFPLGDGAISSTETAAAQGTYSLFVYFNLATVTGSGRGKRSVSRIFAQAPLSNVAITKACESLGIARTVNDVTEVDLNVGITGTDEDWLSSVTSFRNLVSRTKNDNYADTGLEIHALSMQSSLLTLALRGSDAMFNSPVALPFHLEIEDMLTLHFLDDTKYQQMLTLLKNEQAWTLVRHQDTGYLEIALTAMGIAVCSTETMPGDFTCAVRRNIYRRQVVTGAQNSVHALATGVNSHNEHATVSWLQQNLLGVSGFSEDLARNFTRLVRSKHNINDRYNKAWFVNPMYNWATAAGTQSVHALSDKTIVLAVVALDDESKLFGTTRRMLLQATSASQGPEKEAQANTISKSPSKFSVPPLTNKAVNADREIAKIIGIDGMFWVKSGLKVVFNARSQMTAMQVRDEIQARLNRSQTLFASESGSMHLTQFLMQRTQPLKSMPHRRLMAKGDVVPWVGTVNLFWSNLSAHTTIDVYMNWLHCALWLADLETDRPGAEIPDCTQQTTDPMRGFVTSMWTETCNNYSFAVENCSSVLRILDSNGSLATANVPKPPAKNTTANVGHVLAFQLAIAFIDVFTNAETLSAWTQAEMQRVIALEFEIPSQQVVLETLSSDPLSSTRRRLQSAYMLWHVFGPASWRPQTSTIAEGITEAIQRDLGMQVTVEFVDFAPETTPALKEAKKDSVSVCLSTCGLHLTLLCFCLGYDTVRLQNTTLIIVIVVSCVGSVGVISIITYMCIKHPDGIGHVAVTTQQARFEYRPLNSNYVESRTRHLGYGIPNHNLHSPQRHRD